MAVSVTPFTGAPGVEVAPGSIRAGYFTITGDTSYPTGGYALTAAQFGLTQIVFVDPNVTNQAHTVYWNATTGKLQFFTAQNTEVSNATNISTVTVAIQVFGY